jgi:hypothetical protein
VLVRVTSRPQVAGMHRRAKEWRRILAALILMHLRPGVILWDYPKLQELPPAQEHHPFLEGRNGPFQVLGPLVLYLNPTVEAH